MDSGHPPPQPAAPAAVIYILSISGRSSLSTLIAMKYLFIIAAISGLEKDSFSIT